MPDLKSDIVGQVLRLSLPPNQANTLIPLYEAVSNSLHAIQEQFESDTEVLNSGCINIEVIRKENGGSKNPVTGFIIRDNGVGLNNKNYDSFKTPFSQYKIRKGGKGIGRLGWLKVFKKIIIHSKYQEKDELIKRNFSFHLEKENQIKPIDGYNCELGDSPGTVVHLENFESKYANLCPNETDDLAICLISHFLPVFAGDKSPKIILKDQKIIIDLKSLFSEMEVGSKEDMIEIEIESETQPIIIRHSIFKNEIRPKGKKFNRICFCANQRGVCEYSIDDQIGLKQLNEGNFYMGTLTSDYLDSHVNSQRTAFDFSDNIGREIRRQVADSIRCYLKEDLEVLL